MASILMTLSIAGLAAAQAAVQVLPMFTTTYSAGVPAATGGYPAGGEVCSSGEECGSYGSSSTTVAAVAAASTGGYVCSSGQDCGDYSAMMMTTTAAAPAVAYTTSMPYASMTAGGYQQMGCGYGWYKGSNGQCMQESWVSFLKFFPMDDGFVRAMLTLCVVEVLLSWMLSTDYYQ